MLVSGQVFAADPGIVISDKLQALQRFLAQPGNNESQAITDYVDQRIAPLFDTAYMTQWIVGPVGKQMTPTQKIALEKKVRNKLFNLILRRLAGYDGQQVRVRGARQLSQHQAVVSVVVIPRNGRGIPVDFRLYRNNSGWKIFDIVANRMSVLSSFRQQLMSSIRR